MVLLPATEVELGVSAWVVVLVLLPVVEGALAVESPLELVLVLVLVLAALVVESVELVRVGLNLPQMLVILCAIKVLRRQAIDLDCSVEEI